MKQIVKEVMAMIILVAAVSLITILLFFDYIKADADQPQSAVYQMTDDEKEIVAEAKQYTEEKSKLVLSSGYSVDSEDLIQYKQSGNLSQGQASPFDEMPISDVLYDKAGNAYYNATNQNPTNSNTTTSSSQRTNNSTTLNTINTNTTNNNSNKNTNTNGNASNQSTNNNAATNNQQTQQSNSNSNGNNSSAAQAANSDITTSSPSSGTIIPSKGTK